MKKGIRRRRVGNYLKAYPHVYEAYKKAIWLKKIEIGVCICWSAVVAFIMFPIFFFVWQSGGDRGDIKFVCMVGAMLLAFPVVYIFLLLEEPKRYEMISPAELELMEKDLAGENEKVGNWGYSTRESFSVGFYRIPRKGLNAVYRGETFAGRREGHEYELEFYYEDGTHLSAWLGMHQESSHEKNFEQLIRRYDDSVRIYRYRMMDKVRGAYPFVRLKAEVPFVRKETMDELNTLCDGNSFWKLEAKSDNECNGNKEVELTLCGTALTWLLYIVWICLLICLFACFLFIPNTAKKIMSMLWNYSEVTIIFYYLVPLLAYLGSRQCFIKSTRKMTEKAITVLYKDREHT